MLRPILSTCSLKSTGLSDRLNQVVGFCQFVNGEAHRFLPNILSENLSDRFVHIQIWTIVGECHVEYLPTRQQTRKKGKSFIFSFEVNPLGGELRQHLAKGVDVGNRWILPSRLHIE